MNYHEEFKAKLLTRRKNFEGGPDIEAPKGKSKYKPKLIRKNAEWKYPALELDGYAVELYKENEIWLDKIYTLFGHVINRVSSEKSIKFSEVVDEMKKDILRANKTNKLYC